MSLTVCTVDTPAFGRPHQLGNILAAKDKLGHTILTAAASSKSPEMFETVLKAVKTYIPDKVRDVCGAVGAMSTGQQAKLGAGCRVRMTSGRKSKPST